MRRVMRSCVAGAVAAALVLANGPRPARSASPKITVGQIAPIALFWPDFVAQKAGMFSAAGLVIDPVFVGAVTAAAQQVIAGALDIADTTCEVAIRGIAKGGDLTIIGETVSKWPYSIMVPASIKQPQDLKGKKIILATPKQDITIIWNQWLRDQGMQSGDVDQVFDGATPNRYAALVNGAVSAAAVSQPFDFRAMKEGYRQLVDFSFYARDYGFVCAIARKSWVKANPDATRAYLAAMAKAVAWLYDPANKEKAIDILVQVSKQDRDLAAQTYAYYLDKVHPYPAGLEVGMAGIGNILDALKASGDLDAGAKPQDFVDLDYLPAR